MPRLSALAENLTAETAFTVLALARKLKALGKDIVELEIGDSPFPSTPHAKGAGIQAIEENQTGYCPSLGLPRLREAAATFVAAEFGYPARPENIVVASGAKPLEQYFAEALLDPGDGVLVFSPHFPTYVPNLERRQARAVLAPLKVEHAFRPRVEDVRRFLATDPRPRDLPQLTPQPDRRRGDPGRPGGDCRSGAGHRLDDLFRRALLPHGLGWAARLHSGRTRDARAHGRGLYLQQVLQHERLADWLRRGPHQGCRVDRQADQHDSLMQPPLAQWAAQAALEHDAATRDDYMDRFRRKVERLCAGLTGIDGLRVAHPAGTFYVFPDARPACNRLGISSHGLALYLLEGADDGFGVACLGGECFGEAGRGFLRFSCAEPDERIDQAINFIASALSRNDRIERYLKANPQYVLPLPYDLA